MNLFRTSFLIASMPVLLLGAPDKPTIPSDVLGIKKEALIEESFDGDLDPRWHKVVPTFVIENGTLKGEQTRDKTIPAVSEAYTISHGLTPSKEIRAHAAVHGLELPTKDTIVESRIRFEGANMIDVEFTDRKYEGSHYGHICRAQIRRDKVTIIDERDGNMRNDIRAMRDDPTKKEERDKLLKGRSATFPVKLEQNRWYQLRVETVGDEMRVLIDDQPVAYLKSSGIAHETKSKIELGVGGQKGAFGFFDDFKVYRAEAK